MSINQYKPKELPMLMRNIESDANRKWISVKDSLSANDIDVLMFTEYGMAIGCRRGIYWFSDEDVYVTLSDKESHFSYVTHWMPLPEPPEDYAAKPPVNYQSSE